METLFLVQDLRRIERQINELSEHLEGSKNKSFIKLNTPKLKKLEQQKNNLIKQIENETSNRLY